MAGTARSVRRIGTLVALGVASFVGFFTATTQPAAACSCAQAEDSDAFTSADAVFTGTLTGTKTPSRGATRSSGDPKYFDFAVDTVFKGEVRTRQIIVTARSGSSCGLELDGSGPFVVYAYDADSDDDQLTSGLCSGTRPLADGPVPAVFGTGSQPLPGSSPVPEDGTELGWVIWAAGAGGLVILVGGATILIRTRRHRAARSVR